MSQQGPIIVVSTDKQPVFAAPLDDTKMFPIIDTAWADASRAIAQLHPAAVIVAMSEHAEQDLQSLARQVAARQPYLPLIAIDPTTSLPDNAIPFSQAGGSSDRLSARLRAALRVQTLHATVMRRLDRPTGAICITSPPSGIVAVGGYRFLSQDLQEWGKRLGQGALLTALPDRLSGYRLAGRAQDNARGREALNELGLNPLMVEAFRDRAAPT